MTQKVNGTISKLEKIQIYLDTLPKVLRGEIRGLFFRQKNGLLFIGKNVKIMNS